MTSESDVVVTRILVADDDADTRELLRLALQDRYEVVTVANGFEAIRRLESEPFDLAVLDLSMPLIDGSGVIDQIRRQAIPLPVIILSGETDLAQIAAELGVRTWYSKPVGMAELEAAIAELTLRPPRSRSPSGAKPAATNRATTN